MLEKIQQYSDIPSHQPDHQQLFDIASEQHGYFTTEQATQCGYARYLLSYHVKQGTFQRVHWGVYRFRDYPSSPIEPVVAAWIAVGRDATVPLTRQRARAGGTSAT